MTPDEKKDARRMLGQCVRSNHSGAYVREVASSLRLALDQIDADEALMQEARNVILLSAPLELLTARDRGIQYLLSQSSTSASRQERILDALRVRLGEEDPNA